MLKQANFKSKKNKRPSLRRFIQFNSPSRAEVKHVVNDAHANYGSIASAWSEQIVCNPAQGTTETTRIGRRILLKHIHFEGMLVGGCVNALTDDAYNSVRIVLGLYTIGGPLATAFPTINQPISREQNTRGTLITKYYDRLINITNSKDSTGYIAGTRIIRFDIPLNYHITYGDDTNTYPSARFYLSMISDSTAVANPGFEVGFADVSFVDV